MKGRNWNSEKIVSFSAIFISLLTLIVFLYQTNLIKEQQYMSVYPHLSLENAGTNTENYMFLLENNGIGPAIIESINVKVKGGNSYSDIEPYVDDNITNKDTVNYYYTNITAGTLVPEKDEMKIIETKDGKFSTSRILFEILNNKDLNIEIQYRSIYGESWVITNHSDFPKKL